MTFGFGKLDARYNHIGVHELETPEAREKLRRADVIIGVDVMTREERLMVGRDVVERGAAANVPLGTNILYVELDAETDELEFLAAAIHVLKRIPMSEIG